ncbi:type III-A CRISPR-associated RAMP protein Csm4 [Sulfurihydrogenibium yellowstonense]|uniref:CRISPR system Cms protein Csm4 n=1 Tax=Sulfurihydrogenibium yellowstonense SS-5 TaxID=432331 RepID=C4FMA6_9AQUI|nr:type III-A CRISPR-associated RAMP protein Csm4 [Sulfurihydrogenibium yellowstonense]EEP59793.1 crispr-associated ramp protein, Csm4 family [Sulfurihydrogenibium yellowstonense SS-5]
MLKAYKITYLSPTSPVRSFTIFGAICWSYKLIHGEEKLKEFLNGFKENPKFLISSAFPYVKDKFLFPKPILPIKGDSTDFKVKIQRKDYKKARFITLEVLKEVIEGNIRYEEDFVKFKSSSGIIQSIDDNLKIEQKRHTQVRNMINRITSTSENLFSIESDFKIYDEYFLVYFIDTEFENEFQRLIKLTEDIGFGGKKSIGWGRVEISNLDPEPLKGLIDLNADKFITLSPIIPTERINPEESYYDIETFKSYTENTFEKERLKKKVLYIKEGSVLKKKDKEKSGQLKEVENGIYQYGLEFPIGVKYV